MTFEAKVRIRYAIEHCGWGIPSEYQTVIVEAIEKEFSREEKRDYFAGQALAGIVSKLPCDTSDVLDGSEKELSTARGAWSYADAMLAERDK